MSRSEATAWVDDQDLWTDPEDVREAPRGVTADEAPTGEMPAFFDQAVDLPSGALADDRDWGAEWVAAPPRRRRIATGEPRTPRARRPREDAREPSRHGVAVLDREPADVVEIRRPAPRPLELVEAPRVPEREPEHEAPRAIPAPAEDARRTVQVTGRPHHAADARVRRSRADLERRRPRRGAVDRAASRPDRIALYAVILGLFLVVLAATSSSAHAATPRAPRVEARTAHAHAVTTALHVRPAATRHR